MVVGPGGKAAYTFRPYGPEHTRAPPRPYGEECLDGALGPPSIEVIKPQAECAPPCPEARGIRGKVQFLLLGQDTQPPKSLASSYEPERVGVGRVYVRQYV